MKRFFILILLSTAYSTSKPIKKNNKAKEQSTKEIKDESDKRLLLIFSSIVSCFANIVADPHNPEILAFNLSGMAIGILNMLLNTLASKHQSNLKMNKNLKQILPLISSISADWEEQYSYCF